MITNRALPILLTLLLCTLPPPGRAAAPHGVSPALQLAVASAAPGERVLVWVFMKDKGQGIDRKLAEAERALTPHARERRLRNRGAGNLVDRYDIPVDPAYVAALRARGVRVRHVSRWLNAVSVDVEAARVSELTAIPFVRGLDVVHTGRAPLPEPEPVDSRIATGPSQAPAQTSGLDYGASFTQNDLINVIPLHQLGYNGHGVLICMLDSGFNNLGHDAFKVMDIMITRDFVNGDSIVSDQTGQMGSGNHGTNTLSTIGGYAPGNLIGPAWGATYILAKTENTSWERHVEEDAWVAGAEWGDSLGCDIISSSVGYLNGFTNGETGYTWPDMDGNTTIVTIGADIAAGRGILVVNSAGNQGYVDPPANTLIAPADGDSVLAVGAVDGSGTRVSFSSVGLSADSRIKPDVMAMGASVRVASASDPSGYYFANGTSFSCPLTAGAAALLLEANPTLTNMQIISVLHATGSQSGSPDRLMGYGIVDAAAAVALTATGVAATPAPPAGATLYPAYPNPFNPTTTIRYDLVQEGRVHLDVYDIRGRRVTTLVDKHESAGPHTAVWDGTTATGVRAASGVYVCRLVAGGADQSRKMVLLK